MNNIQEIKQGDENYSAQAEAISAQSLDNAIEAFVIETREFDHGGWIQVMADKLNKQNVLITATATDGYNAWLDRWVLDCTTWPPTKTQLPPIKVSNAVAGKRKADSGVTFYIGIEGYAALVAHDVSKLKTLELAKLPDGELKLRDPYDFTDVPKDSTFYHEISTAQRLGHVSGHTAPDGTHYLGAGDEIATNRVIAIIERAIE